MNIVTIDFDIIMHKSLNLYNDLIDDEQEIQFILDNNKDAQFIPNADLYLYNYLTDFILKCIKKLPSNRIKFIDSHEEVLQIFNTDLIKQKESFNVFNIDFHHDIAYDDDDIKTILKDADCGNWIKYIFDNYLNFKEYIWINTEESGDIDDFVSKSYITKKTRIYNINQYNLDALVKTIDILYICRSSPWVPNEQQQLYETWKDIIDNFYEK